MRRRCKVADNRIRDIVPWGRISVLAVYQRFIVTPSALVEDTVEPSKLGLTNKAYWIKL